MPLKTERLSHGGGVPLAPAGETCWRESLHLRLPADVRRRAARKGADAFPGIAAQILRFRVLICLLLVSMTLFMAYGVVNVRIATSFVDCFPHAHPNVKLYDNYNRPSEVRRP